MNKFLYQIKNKEGNFSKGGLNPTIHLWTKHGLPGKIWASKQAFVSHLTLRTSQNEKFEREPSTLFKLYGECTVIEINQDTGARNEIVFKKWYNDYFNTSEKFSKIRRMERQAAAKSAAAAVPPKVSPITSPKSKVAATLFGNQPATASQPAASASKAAVSSWDPQVKITVERAMKQAQKFVPNLTFDGLKSHPKNGETFALVVISGVEYALLKI